MHREPPSIVLFVSADPDTRRRVRAGLVAAGCELFESTRAEDALDECDHVRPNVVLIDWALIGAHDVLRVLAARHAAPVIVLAAAHDAELALEMGAADCMTVPFSEKLLAHRVQAILRCARAEHEIARLRETLASSDGSGAGLSTRAAFSARLEHSVGAHHPERGAIAVLHLALDVERGLPASLDATATKLVLQTSIQRLKDGLRDRDTIAKLDDHAGISLAQITESEITVLLGTLERPQDAYKIARRLQEHLSAPLEVDGVEIAVPASFGIAIHPEDGTRATELLEAAARAMREAREEGKSLIRFARPAMNALIFERLTLESHLRHALDRGEFSVYYQPRVSIETGEIVSVEALLRWKHPELGMVSPAHFIPVAEESGLILPIGEWVLREATSQNRRWRDAGLPRIGMAVNLSSAQFRQPDLVGVVRRALDDAGLDAESLELELTESMLLQKGDITVKTLDALKAMGVHLSIDDFGTGYSSLSYIKRFPVDALKIDQSFIREVTSSAEDSALTTSIILMGKSLGLTVVAEGVETRSQLGMLQALGCDQAQGYLFSRPVPADEAAALIAVGFGSSIAA